MYSELFTKHAELLKAIAHPRRLEIIHLLRNQELPVSDIHTMLDLPQANISQHLIVLRQSKIVKTRRDGKSIYYTLAHPNIIQACDLIRKFLIENDDSQQFLQLASIDMQDLLPIVHDPVCKMRLSPKTAGFHQKFNGDDYYFCASGCQKAFLNKPSIYITSQEV